MNAVMAMRSDAVETAEREPLAWVAARTAPAAGRPYPADSSTELLRTIAQVLDIRSVFPRVSEIVKPVLAHDALELVFSDRAGRVTLEARSTEELPARATSTCADDERFLIVGDLQRSRPAHDPVVVAALVAAGYRSVLSVRCDARGQIMRLAFLSKHPEAYGPQDVATAQHIADYVGVAVAHEQLAAAERDRAEARGRSQRLDDCVRAVTHKGERLAAHSRMIGRSDAWQRVLTRALRVAPTDTTVFLEGESGTGKEVVARFIHQASSRKTGPFIAINCAALPEQLLESELFGYERGAFTGAHLAKPGQIELASRGVLFLDEVSEMSLSAQAKFLRFLQEREYQRLGGTRTLKANVRVLAASNANLRQAVEQRKFREDLFYRLQVFDIPLPPLRERLTDVPLLAEHFLEQFGEEMGRRRPASLTDEARDALVSYSWPGNVRELRNVLERAAILSDEGAIERRHLSLQAMTVPSVPSHDLATMERQTIERVLRETDWNKTKTARRVGLTRTQLYVRLRRHGLENPESAAGR
jgi:transcriptional regulator with GAF, ATPase, and Fis domain